jgi:predicted alpha/beta-fold hydrolase
VYRATAKLQVADLPVRLVYHDKGGHCGFLTGPQRGNTSTGVQREGRWLPNELACFLDHVDTSLCGDESSVH